MAEPSHRSTTAETAPAATEVDMDTLTSGDLDLARAMTNNHPTPPKSAPRHRRARHAKVVGDESPTVPLSPVSEPVPDLPRPDTTGPDTTGPDAASPDATEPAVTESAAVAEGWRIVDPPDADAVGGTEATALPETQLPIETQVPPESTAPAGSTLDGDRSASLVREPHDGTDSPPPAIEVVGLHKRFGENVAVESVSFSVAKGSILALLGPNGAGKTTTVNMLCTLLKPDGGSATVAGHDVASDAPGVRRSIMLTGQFAALDEALSGRDNLILFGRLMGLSKSAARARADELLTSFDLTAAAGRRVGEYSGGMRRRIDIACGLVTQPEVVFLDEPTTGLDPRSRQEVWKLVESLRDQGVTTLLTTQYLEEADTLSDHIVVIDRGRVIASGTADELKSATGASHYEVTPTDPADLDRLLECLGDLVGDTTGAVAADRTSLAVPAPDGADTLVEIVQRTTGAGIRLSDVALRRPSLDEVFLALTDPAPADPALTDPAAAQTVSSDTADETA
ncbi:ATP-binding cassette domain-containing protein [Gordonia sp. PKS22-38]|uniref:ATP-binding cassette domain-containing protein n=1 Tax=Gordonia prachuapensis TaxID=3115651 RepID=A0ABU7MNW9_9ACTN|nr:ATP-binding cassette domain-containing protein [Gordonia sp. PKS22-38]